VEGPDHGERGARVYNGGPGAEPQRGPGAEPLVRRSGEQSSPEAESFLRIGHPKEGANWPHVRVLNERNCILLLDSNETGGLIVMNVLTFGADDTLRCHPALRTSGGSIAHPRKPKAR